jgi:hypothetical protein
MLCLVIFGASFIIYGLMSIISGKSMSPGRMFSKRSQREDLTGKSARIAGAIYLVVGIAIIVLSYVYLD